MNNFEIEESDQAETNNKDLFEVQVSDDIPDDQSESLSEFNDNDSIESDEAVPDLSMLTFSEHTDCVYCSCVNPKIPGLILSGGGDDIAYLWKYSFSSEAGIAIIDNVTKLSGHKDTVVSVGFNFDGTMALSGAYDGTIRIWNAITGELKQVLEGPEDIEWAEWHSKGNAVLAGSKDGTVWMWMAHNGQCVHVFAGHDGGVSAGCFSKDGKTVCTGGEDGTIRLWAPKSGQCNHVFEEYFGHAAVVTCLVSSDDGDMLLSGSADGTVKLLQISGKRVLQTFQHSAQDSSQNTTLNAIKEESDLMDVDNNSDNDLEEDEGEVAMSVECVAFSKNEFHWAASGGLDKTLKIWDITNGVCRCVCQHEGSVVSLAWHSTLPVVTTAALDCIVRIWDARAGSILMELTGHSDMVTSLCMNPIWNGFYAPIKESDDSTKVTHEHKSNNSLRNSQIEQDVTMATDVIVSVSDDKTAKIFHINTRALLK